MHRNGNMGNMILIKDRHLSIVRTVPSSKVTGKYDTYKGSTPIVAPYFLNSSITAGKYDTYKGFIDIEY